MLKYIEEFFSDDVAIPLGQGQVFNPLACGAPLLRAGRNPFGSGTGF